MKKKLLGLFLCSLLLYNGWVANARASEAAVEAASTSARAAYLMDLSTGRTLYAWNANEKLPMASTTKVMTALLALEYGRLDEMVTTSHNAYGVPGTSIYLSLDESLSLENMLYGLMLASGNDAAVAVAEHIGGSAEGFAAQMNARASELGAMDTHFVNPHGLPAEGHYTTAFDLAQIAAAAMRQPKFREIVSTQRASIPWPGRDYDRVLSNKNQLLSSYLGATGVKTGFTRAAGRCLVFGARQRGMEIVGVLLNCPDWFAEAARLMDRCFDTYLMIEMLSDGDPVRPVPVAGGLYAAVPVRIEGALAAPFTANETPRIALDLPSELSAPLAEGTPLGWARLYAGDTLLSERRLVAAASVPARSMDGAFQRILARWLLLAPG